MAQDVEKPRGVAPTRAYSDVFISYSRTDRNFVTRLNEALEARGRTAWVDWQGIPPTAEWMTEIREAIDASDTFVVVISPDSIGSSVCGEELDIAIAVNKRIVPVVARNVDAAQAHKDVAKLNWLFMRDGDDFDRGVEQLIETLDTDLEAVRFHTGLLVRSREWSQASEPGSRLLRGSDLDEAERYVASPGKGPAPTSDQARFILASRRAATRRHGMLIAGVSIALVVSMVLASVAYVQRNQAVENERVSEAGRLAALADSQLEIDPELSLLLALRSASVAKTSQAENALRRALLASHVVSTLRGSTNLLVGVSVSPDGQRALTRSSWIPTSGFREDTGDHGVRIWDVATRELLYTIAGGDPITVATFAPDDGEIVLGDEGGAVRVYDGESGQELGHLDGTAPISAISVGAGGQVAILDASGDTRLWSSPGREEINLASSGATGMAVTALPDAGVATAGPRGVAIWDDGARQIGSVRLPFAPGVLSARADRLFVMGAERIAVIDLRTERVVSGWKLQRIGTLDLELQTPVAPPVPSPDGSQVASARDDGQITLWDASSGRQLLTLSGHVGNVTDMAFSADGSQLVSSGVDQQAIVWDLRTGAPIANLRGHVGPVFGVDFALDDSEVVTAGADTTARIWRIDQAAPTGVLGKPHPAYVVAFSPDGREMAVSDGYGDSKVSIWDLADNVKTTAIRTDELPAEDRPIANISYSPDGATLVTTHVNGYVRFWDAAEGSPIGAIEIPANQGPGTSDAQRGLARGVWMATYDEKGTRLATASQDGVARTWDVASGELLNSFEGHLSSVNVVDWSPDGRQLVTASDDGTVRTWDASTGDPIRVLRGHSGPVFGASWSPDGSTILSAGADGVARIWDATTGASVRTLRGHTDLIISADLSADGRWYATASFDNTVRVWEVSTGDVVTIFRGLGDQPVQVSFDPTGPRLALTTYDREFERFIAEMYSCEMCGTMDQLIALAEARVTRDLTALEFQQFDVGERREARSPGGGPASPTRGYLGMSRAIVVWALEDLNL